MRKLVAALAVVMVAGLLFVLSPTPAAEAYPGCRSKVVEKVDNWGHTEWFAIWDNSGKNSYKIRVSGETMYTYCPNGWRPDKLQPHQVRWCYTALNGDPHRFFNGVRFNPYFFDSNTGSNPDTFWLPPNGNHRCGYQFIHDFTGSNTWLRYWQDPAWSVTAWINIRYRADEEFVFTWGNHIKPFRPKRDPNVSGWYR